MITIFLVAKSFFYHTSQSFLSLEANNLREMRREKKKLEVKLWNDS